MTNISFFQLLQQYIITTLPKELQLPPPMEQHETFLKRAKGVKKTVIANHLSLNDFIRVAKNNQCSAHVSQYSLKKKDFNIYMTKGQKILLSKGNIKRLFCDSFQSDSNYFSIPLFLKRMIEN